VRALVRRIRQAAEARRPRSLLLTGGVAANSLLRAECKAAAASLGLTFVVPPLDLTTDNAAMIGAAGFLAHERGVRAGWDLNAEAALALS
jgi:N6-L-threonylcarbamoyladenine synthase